MLQRLAARGAVLAEQAADRAELAHDEHHDAAADEHAAAYTSLVRAVGVLLALDHRLATPHRTTPAGPAGLARHSASDRADPPQDPSPTVSTTEQSGPSAPKPPAPPDPLAPIDRAVAALLAEADAHSLVPEDDGAPAGRWTRPRALDLSDPETSEQVETLRAAYYEAFDAVTEDPAERATHRATFDRMLDQFARAERRTVAHLERRLHDLYTGSKLNFDAVTTATGPP